MTNEELRILILRVLRAVGRIGARAESVCAQISVEEKDIGKSRIGDSIQYLLDRGYLREKKSKLSGEVRLRIAPDGADLLEELDA